MNPKLHPLHSKAWRVWTAELRESFLMAMSALAAHKLRSALTLLGVLVGVFSIIVVMTAMRVMQRSIESELGRLGNRTFVVAKWPAVPFHGPRDFEKYWRRNNISFAQGQQLKERATLPFCVGVETGFWSGEMTSRFATTPPEAQLLGETPGSFPAKNWMIQEGRALADSDVEGARDVCVLGYGLAKTLFPFGSPLGDRIKADGINYTVIGLLESKGAMQGGDQDNFAIIPLSTGLNRYGRAWRSLAILVQARDTARYDDTVEQVRGILRSIRKVPPGAEDDFEIFSSDSMIAQFNSFTRMVRLGIAAVSSIALLAAGIGIMNIMLVSVTERTREIGIRRAVGAKKRNILAQFIMEAVMLCQVGGVAGVALGIGGGNVAAYFLKAHAVIPLDWVALGLILCSVVGVVFGTYPAYKAAQIDPIESLRYE
jgi:putative ABC transport system permease protein